MLSAFIAGAWQAAVNCGDVDGIRELSDPEIAIVGPRGTARGVDSLLDWIGRVGARLDTRSIQEINGAIVAEQQGVWQVEPGGAMQSVAEVVSVYRVDAGRVRYYARFDDLAAAIDHLSNG